MDDAKSVAAFAILAAFGCPGAALAYRVYTDAEFAWAMLDRISIVAGIVALIGLFVALSRWSVFRADTETILSQRVRTNATAEATGQPGNTAQVPWLMMPNSPQLPPPADAYSPDVLADGATYSNGRAR